MMWFFFWIGGAIAIGVWAGRWDRSGAGWCLLAILISPLLAALFLAAVGASGQKCVHCAEMVKSDAKVCKHCGRNPKSKTTPVAADNETADAACHELGHPIGGTAYQAVQLGHSVRRAKPVDELSREASAGPADGRTRRRARDDEDDLVLEKPAAHPSFTGRNDASHTSTRWAPEAYGKPWMQLRTSLRVALVFTAIAAVAAHWLMPDQQSTIEEQARSPIATIEEAKAPADRDDDREIISVPSDPSARYTLHFLAVRPSGLVEVTTRRDGASGSSYAKRLINCTNQTFKYLGDGDTLREMERSTPDVRMSELTTESISSYVAVFACQETRSD